MSWFEFVSSCMFLETDTYNHLETADDHQTDLFQVDLIF